MEALRDEDERGALDLQASLMHHAARRGSVFEQGGISSRRVQIWRTHSFFEKYIQVAWVLSTGLGIVLFALDLPLIAFVKVSIG